MDQPPQPFGSHGDDTQSSVLSKVPLAVGSAAVSAAAGGWLMSIIAGVFLYVPLIPGAVVGYAVNKVCKTNRVLICVIAAFFGFAGMVFGDALTFELVDYAGTWNYITHFWHAATLSKVLFWIANAAVGYWFARATPVGRYSGLPVAIDQAKCPHCSQGNLPTAKFCAHCGRQMN